MAARRPAVYNPQAYNPQVGMQYAQQQQNQNQPAPVYQPGPAALPFLAFDIGNAASGSGSGPIPSQIYSGGAPGSAGFSAFEDEPPLLEELGINPQQIWQKTKSVLVPFRRNLDLHQDADLSGPFLFCILFGLCQLLGGKLHFGVILGWGSLASAFLYAVTRLLSGNHLDLYRSFSLVGYSLLPMVLFSALSLLIPRQGIPIFSLAAITIVWCTWSCSSLLVVLAPHAEEQKRLISYACVIIFLAFSLLVVF